MLTAVHTILYADDADAARAFFRDVLGWPHVDAGGGWLIFRTGPSELGVHPASEEGWSTNQHHEIALMCDDVEATVAELTAKGVEFTGGIQDQGFGLTTTLKGSRRGRDDALPAPTPACSRPLILTACALGGRAPQRAV